MAAADPPDDGLTIGVFFKGDLPVQGVEQHARPDALERIAAGFDPDHASAAQEPRMPSFRTCAVATLVAMAFGHALPAGAADPVTDAMQSAYPPYRLALFRTSGGTPAEALESIDAATARWQQVADRYGSAPTLPYAGDPSFAATLKDVLSRLSDARRQVVAGKPADAHETLEGVRDLLADLRLRNGVVVFSDAMNAYHAAMEHTLKDGAALVTAVDGPMRLMAHVGALELLAARLRSEAPRAARDDAEFTQMLSAIEGSVAALRSAAMGGDRDAMRRALEGLKRPYSRMFVKFG